MPDDAGRHGLLIEVWLRIQAVLSVKLQFLDDYGLPLTDDQLCPASTTLLVQQPMVNPRCWGEKRVLEALGHDPVYVGHGHILLPKPQHRLVRYLGMEFRTVSSSVETTQDRLFVERWHHDLPAPGLPAQWHTLLLTEPTVRAREQHSRNFRRACQHTADSRWPALSDLHFNRLGGYGAPLADCEIHGGSLPATQQA